MTVGGSGGAFAAPRHIGEGQSSLLMPDGLAGQLLPAQDGNIHVMRVELQNAGDTPGLLGSNDGGAAPRKPIEDQAAALGTI